MKRILFLAIAYSLTTFTTQAQFNDGIFVVNEGGAQGSVSFISGTTVQNDIYSTVNPGMSLGSIVQSMGIHDGKAYIVSNVSNKITVVNATTFVHQGVITAELENPRFITFSGANAYVTCWGDAAVTTDDYVAVINTADNTIITTIPVTEGPERILLENGKLYVAHKGGYGYGTSVSVINPATNTLQNVIGVGDVPGTMVVKDGYLYVMCEGKPSWGGSETTGALYKIDLATNTVPAITVFPDVQHPSNLVIGGDDLFFTVDSGVFKMPVSSTVLPTVPLFSVEEQDVYGVYGMQIIDDKLYIADAADYVSNGGAYVYNLSGAPVADYTVGLIPNGFYKSPQTSAGVIENMAVTFSVYPNPASEVIYINSDEVTAVTIFDVSGRIVKSENYTTAGITVSGLAKGTYFVEMTAVASKSVKQLIIK